MLIHEPEPIPPPMSKKGMIEQLRHRLASNDRRALRALMRIYQNQTDDELYCEATIERNGIGFTGVIMTWHLFFLWFQFVRQAACLWFQSHRLAAWITL